MNLREKFSEKEIKIINRFRNHRRIEKYAFTFCSLLLMFVGICAIGATVLIIHKVEIDNLYEAIIKEFNPYELYPGYYFTLRLLILTSAICFGIALSIYTDVRLSLRNKLLLKCINIIERIKMKMMIISRVGWALPTNY